MKPLIKKAMLIWNTHRYVECPLERREIRQSLMEEKGDEHSKWERFYVKGDADDGYKEIWGNEDYLKLAKSRCTKII